MLPQGLEPRITVPKTVVISISPQERLNHYILFRIELTEVIWYASLVKKSGPVAQLVRVRSACSADRKETFT